MKPERFSIKWPNKSNPLCVSTTGGSSFSLNSGIFFLFFILIFFSVVFMVAQKLNYMKNWFFIWFSIKGCILFIWVLVYGMKWQPKQSISSGIECRRRYSGEIEA